MDEALLDRDDLPQERRDDWGKVQNYIAAMNRAVSALERLSISSRLIQESHRIFMQGVRGLRGFDGVRRIAGV